MGHQCYAEIMYAIYPAFDLIIPFLTFNRFPIVIYNVQPMEHNVHVVQTWSAIGCVMKEKPGNIVGLSFHSKETYQSTNGLSE